MIRQSVAVLHALLSVSAILSGCVLQAPAVAASTAIQAMPAHVDCTFGAFVQDDDPTGLNVRAAPGTAARVLGALPPTFTAPGDERFHVRVEVTVTGAARGWFHIRGARDNPALTDRPARPMYDGEGWVAGRKLTVKSQARDGHAAPDGASPVVLRLRTGDSFDGDDMVDAGHLVACQGRWAQVEFDEKALSADTRAELVVDPQARAGMPPGRLRVWLDRLCGVQETTCQDGAE